MPEHVCDGVESAPAASHQHGLLLCSVLALAYTAAALVVSHRSGAPPALPASLSTGLPPQPARDAARTESCMETADCETGDVCDAATTLCLRACKETADCDGGDTCDEATSLCRAISSAANGDDEIAPLQHSSASDDFDHPTDSGGGSDDWATDVAANRTTIVFVLLDDVGINDITESVDIAAATPFFHSLAETGISLTRYYAQGICTPGRSTVLTGKVHDHTDRSDSSNNIFPCFANTQR